MQEEDCFCNIAILPNGEHRLIKSLAGISPPGGYVRCKGSILEQCIAHLKKDGFTSSHLSLYSVLPPVFWDENQHPNGRPISIVCILKLEGPYAITEGKFFWSETVTPTKVPMHTKLQESVFEWIKHNHKTCGAVNTNEDNL